MSTELTFKDRLAVNFDRMQKKFGSQEFDFIPESYCIPEHLQEFKVSFS